MNKKRLLMMMGGTLKDKLFSYITSLTNYRLIYPLNDASTTAAVGYNKAVALGKNIVVNGTFTTDTDWTKGAGWTIDSGKLVATGAASGTTTYQTCPLTAGITYQLVFTVSDYSEGTCRIYVGNSSSPISVTTNGTHTNNVVCVDGVLRITIMAIGASSTFKVDDVTVKAVITENFLPNATVSEALPNQKAGRLNLKGYLFDGSNDKINIYSNNLNSIFDPDLVTIGLFIKAATASIWNDVTTRWLLNIRAGSSESVDQISVITDGVGGIIVNLYRNSVRKAIRISVTTTELFLLEIVVDKANDAFYVLVNGVQYGVTRTTLSDWKYNLETSACIIGNWLSHSGTGHSGFMSSFFTLAEARSAANGLEDARQGGAAIGNIGIAADSSANIVVCDGDSLTLGSGAGVTQPYPSQLCGLLTNYEIFNSGVGDETADTLLSTVAAVIDPLFEAARTKNIYVLCTGINDITADTSSANIISDISNICLGRKTAGWSVIVCNLTPVNGLSAPRETVRSEVNASITTNWATYADAYVDFAGDSRLDDPTDAIYYVDGIHNTNAGYAVRAELVAAAIATL